MSIHHPSVGRSVTTGVRLVVQLYPWSILWVLLAASLILLLEGSWASTVLMVLLVGIVVGQAVRTDHIERPPPRRGHRRAR